MTKREVFWSYVALFVAGLVALSQCLKQNVFRMEYSCCTFVVITLYSLLGLLVFGRESPNADLKKWHDRTKILINTLGIPCYTTDVWLRHGILRHRAVAWLYTAMGCIPALACVLDEFPDSIFFDGLVYGYCTTISAVACQNGNFSAVLGVTCFMAGHHIHRREERLYGKNRSPETAFNLFATVFVACAAASLKTTHK